MRGTDYDVDASCSCLISGLAMLLSVNPCTPPPLLLLFMVSTPAPGKKKTVAVVQCCRCVIGRSLVGLVRSFVSSGGVFSTRVAGVDWLLLLLPGGQGPCHRNDEPMCVWQICSRDETDTVGLWGGGWLLVFYVLIRP